MFLSNGPGDPAATAGYAVPTIQGLIKADLPIFGICLGHQLLALALGGQTRKMRYGHRGANHPVKNLLSGAVEITSQNHGFEVIAESLPANVETTHLSLFDGTHEGMRLKGKPVFSVQYHPESSPGPHDSHYLFEQFFKSAGCLSKAVIDHNFIKRQITAFDLSGLHRFANGEHHADDMVGWQVN